jgi:hypothetical protein
VVSEVFGISASPLPSNLTHSHFGTILVSWIRFSYVLAHVMPANDR